MDTLETTIDEIAPDIFRLSTWLPEVSPDGFTFNQFLIRDEQPLLFHTGPRALFPLVAEAVSTLVPVESLRWISFGHVEADECGSMNMWLASAPDSQVAYGALGCMVSLEDLCDRSPLPLDEGQVIELGDRRVRQISTPHVPHGWEAQVLFEETTSTLFCGDLLTQFGRTPACTEHDVVEPALAAEAMFRSSSLGPGTSATLEALAALEPTTLAIMHGASFRGDGGAALRSLSDGLEQLATT